MKIPGASEAEKEVFYRCKEITVDPKPFLGLCDMCRHNMGPVYDCTIFRRSDIWDRRICLNCIDRFKRNKY